MNDKCNLTPEELQILQQERLFVQVATAITRRMKELRISRKELADRLNVTKGRITQYLCGERNLTLRTLADIFTALESQVLIIEQRKVPQAAAWEALEMPNENVIRVRDTHYRHREIGPGHDGSMSLAS